MNYSANVHKGRFNPKNPRKYRGNVANVIYRSSYELKFMKWCDMNDDITEWGSEEIVIPYRSPLDNRMHRYFPDFYIKIREQKYLIEVKPYRFTQEPKIPKRKTKRFISEVKQWGVNLAKWQAAEEICIDSGWVFKIITERELGISYK
jgi:hypothetical protein|tara:strand:- start:2438 stop:2881 length:444 start_codon:yes stop_codon:yes gene_type:complete